MSKVKLSVLFIGLVFILTSVMLVSGNPVQITDTRPEGQFEGIRFNYGIHDYQDSGSHSDRISLESSENWDSTSSYKTRIKIALSRGNDTATYYEMFTNDPKYGDYDNAVGSVNFTKEIAVYESNSPLVPDGTFSILDFLGELNASGTPFGYREPYTVSIPVYIYSSFDEFIDFIVVPVIYINLGSSNLDADDGYFYQFYPSHREILGKFEVIPVKANTHSFGFYEGSGFYQFKYDYTVSGRKAEVNIFDDGSLHTKYEAFLENDLQYTETGSFYNLINSEHNTETIFTIIGDHTFSLNGTVYSFTDGQFLPEEFLVNPESYNNSYSYNGYTNSSWIIEGRLQSISAAQSITQILTPPNLNQKIVWQNSFPAVLQAFTKQTSGEKIEEDGSVTPVTDVPPTGVISSDRDEAANLNFSPETNDVSYATDVVLGHTGYLEAYQYDYSYTGSYDSNSTYTNSVDPVFNSGDNSGIGSTEPGRGGTGVGLSTDSYYYEYSYRMGNINQDYEANLVWLDPVRSNGKISFAWALELTDFPTSWFLNYYENINAPMDLSFGYIYEIEIDDVTKLADTSFSLTFEYGELTPKIKSFMEGFSLATTSYTQWIVKKEVEVENDVLNSVSTISDNVEFGNSNRKFGDIEFGNAKKVYSLFTPKGVFRYEVITSVMALHYYTNMNGVADQSESVGQSRVETVTQEKMNSAYLMKSTSQIIPDFRVRSFIIMITYPEWSGNKIVHDPTYSTVSVVKQYSGDNYTSTGVIITTTPTATSVSGFETLVLIMGLISVIALKKLSRK